MAYRLQTLAVGILFFSLSTGCHTQPRAGGRLTATLGSTTLPARHHAPPVWPLPFDPHMGRQALGFLGGAFQVSGRFLQSLEFVGGSDNGGAALFLLTLAVVPAAIGVIPVAGYVAYSGATGACMVASHVVRTVVVDLPKALLHRLRTRKGQVIQDLRQLVRLWKGPGLRPNPILAIRGSGDAIRAHVARLELATGRRLGANPERWIAYYEGKYETWRWERPE